MNYSIINRKDIANESNIFRLDAEFFHPVITQAKSTLRQITHSTLRDLGASIIHPTEIQRQYVKTGIQILLAQNIRDNFLDLTTAVFMSENLEGELRRNRLQLGDVVITRSGANYGQCATYLGLPARIYACADDLVIRGQQIPGTYLATFLNTTFGKTLIESCKYGGSQPHISPQTLYDIPIFIPSADALVKKIDTIVRQAFETLQQADLSYQKAQSFLLEEVGLSSWQPRHRVSFVRNFADTQRANRTDAEYFQPKYEDIVNAIKRYPGDWDTLGQLVSIRKCMEVGSKNYREEGVPFIRVSNLTPFEITEEKYISEDLYAEISQHQPKQDEILFSKDGTPGIAHYLRDQPPKMIPSGGILRLKTKTNRIIGECLTLMLNSTLVQEQVNRDVGGSLILHWRPDQVREAVIPILPNDIQAQIQLYVNESYDLRGKSRHLLECAKRTIEIAIEQGEETATEWLGSETS